MQKFCLLLCCFYLDSLTKSNNADSLHYDGASNNAGHETFLDFDRWSKTLNLEWWSGLCSTITKMIRQLFVLSEVSKIKIRKHVLPQPPFASLEVFERVEFDQGKVGKDKNLVNQDSVKRFFGYPLVTSSWALLLFVIGDSVRHGKKLTGHTLVFYPRQVLPNMMFSAVSMKKSRFENWCMKA